MVKQGPVFVPESVRPSLPLIAALPVARSLGMSVAVEVVMLHHEVAVLRRQVHGTSAGRPCRAGRAVATTPSPSPATVLRPAGHLAALAP
jgi:hypothetical protein